MWEVEEVVRTSWHGDRALFAAKAALLQAAPS